MGSYNDSRQEWREFDRESRRAGGRMAVWIVVAVLFFAVLGIGGWAFKVAVSDVKGQGDAVRVKNSAPNRIKAQEAYVAAMNEVKRSDRNLTVLAADKKANPDDRAAATRYTGAVSYCQSVVADYNALADKYRSADFLPQGYPVSIDDMDPATDCQEN